MHFGIAALFAAGALLAYASRAADEKEAGPTPPKQRVLASGLKFPEGPALSSDGQYLYFVNCESSAVSRIDLKRGKFEYEWLTLPDGGKGNGSTMGVDGFLYVADHAAKRIVRINTSSKQVVTIVDTNDEGGPLRGPNDLVFDAKGGLYFTDPAGSWDEPVGAVYYAAPGTRQVTKIADKLRFPNGIAISPDGLTLYVVLSPEHTIEAIDLTPNGVVPPGGRRVFATLSEKNGGDGMRFSKDGFLYVAVFGDGLIAKIDPSGRIVDRFPVKGGKNPTNLCFSKDGKSIYVTETQGNTVVQIPFPKTKSERPTKPTYVSPS
jgi:gluconolactonase